ncbi:MAG: hypothetical protein JSU04_20175 [Bdellovibrionales bacterium]|nr:hypothetical protein [Bdellovibrionales bacterium]
MKFRRYVETSEICSKNLRENINTLTKDSLAHLMPTENIHNYEHGIKVEYKDVDQNVRQTEFKRHHTSAGIQFSAITNGDFSNAIHFIDTIIEGLSSALAKTFFAKIDEVTEETGQIIDNKGQPISGDMILKSLEMTGVRVTKTGSISAPQIVAGPALAQKLQEVQKDPEFQKKFQELYERKALEAIQEEQTRKSKFPHSGDKK